MLRGEPHHGDCMKQTQEMAQTEDFLICEAHPGWTRCMFWFKSQIKGSRYGEKNVWSLRTRNGITCAWTYAEAENTCTTIFCKLLLQNKSKQSVNLYKVSITCNLGFWWWFIKDQQSDSCLFGDRRQLQHIILSSCDCLHQAAGLTWLFKRSLCPQDKLQT